MTYHEEHEKPERKTSIVVRILPAIIIVGLALGIYHFRGSLTAKVNKVFASTNEDPIPVTSVEKKPYQIEVPAIGEVIGLETTPIPTPSTRSGGLKIAWIIPEGSFVKAGDVVIRFDSTDARLNLEKQQNTLDANSQRTKITSGNQTTNEKVLEIDRTDAEKDYTYAITVMPQDETIFSKWDIIEAQINAGFAKEKIGFLGNKSRVQKRINRSDQQILAIEKNKAQAEFGIAKQTLDALELKAPKDGLLLYRRERNRDPQIGDESQGGQNVVELVDLNALQAKMYVLERDAGSLSQGKEVKILLDSISERTFNGTVRTITALAQSLERGSPLKYFTCEVTIRDAGIDLKRIKPGMALKAMVVLESYASCVVLPASAVTSKGSDDIVYVKQGEKFLPRPVKLGGSAHGQATILDGLNEKELVALRNPYEERKAHLPDFSKASAGSGGGPGRMMRIEMH
jgi:multidrug efflux pump subunit AcrA (membrane-fusion protein)